MNTPTINDVVVRLAQLSRMLDEATAEIAELDEQSVRAKARYQVSYARAFLSEDGSVDARKQKAALVCNERWLDSEIGEQKVRAARERIRTLRDQLDVGRSLNAAIRAEFAASGVGQP